MFGHQANVTHDIGTFSPLSIIIPISMKQWSIEHLQGGGNREAHQIALQLAAVLFGTLQISVTNDVRSNYMHPLVCTGSIC